MDAAFSALGVPGAFFGFLAAGVAAAFALVLVRSLLPVPAASGAGVSGADVAVAEVSVATTWSSTWAGWFVLAFLLAMSGLPKGVGNAAAAPNASRHHDRTVTSPSPSTSRQFRHNSSVFRQINHARQLPSLGPKISQSP